jgi:hypothetical protein
MSTEMCYNKNGKVHANPYRNKSILLPHAFSALRAQMVVRRLNYTRSYKLFNMFRTEQDCLGTKTAL